MEDQPANEPATYVTLIAVSIIVITICEVYRTGNNAGLVLIGNMPSFQVGAIGSYPVSCTTMDS